MNKSGGKEFPRITNNKLSQIRIKGGLDLCQDGPPLSLVHIQHTKHFLIGPQILLIFQWLSYCRNPCFTIMFEGSSINWIVKEGITPDE